MIVFSRTGMRKTGIFLYFILLYQKSYSTVKLYDIFLLMHYIQYHRMDEK